MVHWRGTPDRAGRRLFGSLQNDLVLRPRTG